MYDVKKTVRRSGKCSVTPQRFLRNCHLKLFCAFKTLELAAINILERMPLPTVWDLSVVVLMDRLLKINWAALRSKTTATHVLNMFLVHCIISADYPNTRRLKIALGSLEGYLNNVRVLWDEESDNSVSYPNKWLYGNRSQKSLRLSYGLKSLNIKKGWAIFVQLLKCAFNARVHHLTGVSSSRKVLSHRLPEAATFGSPSTIASSLPGSITSRILCSHLMATLHSLKNKVNR